MGPRIADPARRRPLGDDPDLEHVVASAQARQDDAVAIDGQPGPIVGQRSRRTAAGRDEERMTVGLGRGQDLRSGGLARIRQDREGEGPRPEQLRPGRGQDRAGRLVAVGVVVAADQAGRPEHGDGQLATGVEQLVLDDVPGQHGDPAGGHERVGGLRRQRVLAVAALGRQAALDHRELALGVGPLGGAGERQVEPEAVIDRPIVVGQ